MIRGGVAAPGVGEETSVPTPSIHNLWPSAETGC